MFLKAIFLSPTNAQCRKRSPCGLSYKRQNLKHGFSRYYCQEWIVKILTQSVRDFPRVQLGQVREPFHERFGVGAAIAASTED
jgi:hypothetical protein